MKNPTNHISFRIMTPHQMTFIRYIRPNIAESPPHHYLASRKITPERSLQKDHSRKITPESLHLLRPRNHLRNMMGLYMSLLRFINSSDQKQLLPSRNIILRLSIKWLRKGVFMSLMSLMSLIMNYLLLRPISLRDRLTLAMMMMHPKMKLIPF